MSFCGGLSEDPEGWCGETWRVWLLSYVVFHLEMRLPIGEEGEEAGNWSNALHVILE